MDELSTLIQVANSKENRLNFFKFDEFCKGCIIIQYKDLEESLIPHKISYNGFSYFKNLDITILRHIIDKLSLNPFDNVMIIGSHRYSDTSELNKTILQNDVKAVVDLELTNHTRYINKHFEFINSLLPKGGDYLGCVETNNQRNDKIYRKINFYLAKVIIFLEFLFHRVIPKISFFQPLYYFITKGRYRFLTKSETLGRLASCGFHIQDDGVNEINNITWFTVKKQREPYFDMAPTYGPLIKLRRVGKNGKIFNVYKFRTMHPYSEYIQDYVIRLNGYNEVGKPANDFRVAEWGKYFRKYWVDELPQIINVLKGEMKIMGVRPLSVVRFSEFPKEMQDLRIREKTGCIPPYVALNMPSETGNIEAEKIYLLEKQENPLLTDLKYISMAVYNILTHRIESS